MASRRPKWLWLVIVIVMLIVLVGGGLYYYFRSNSGQDASTFGEYVPDEGRTHVAEGSAIAYKANPPASGPHYPSPEPWGIYTNTIAQGYWVHNLEHGGIAVLYDCPNGCQSVIDQLEQAFKTFPRDKYGEVKLVGTPYSGLPNHAQAAAIAWDYRLIMNTFDVSKVLAFYNAHVDRGPEDIP
ncbi:MAG TPA: DUF3105 domain-containing protein [Chloroflexota bacterium]|nr:DUF3105 domain-containing protein [Chloroflexota bacterium]